MRVEALKKTTGNRRWSPRAWLATWRAKRRVCQSFFRLLVAVSNRRKILCVKAGRFTSLLVP
jgi:hypothetical protein